MAGKRVELGDRIDLVAEHRDAPGGILKVGREDLDGIAADAKRAAHEIDVLALILLGDEVCQQLTLIQSVADRHLEGHRRIGLDRADTVDAGNRGDDDAVVALQQRAGRRVAHPVDLLVDRTLLLDERVGARHIGFRLVIVVIGDEIFDRVVGEEVLELGIELRRQRLVRREDDGRALGRLDHLGHGEGLARAGDAEQDLAALAGIDALDKVADGGRLVAGGLVVGGHADRDAALGFFRPGGAVRRPQLAVLEQRIAALDQRRQGFHGGGDRTGGEAAGLFQRHVHAGDRVEAGAGARLRIGGGADRHAAGGLRGGGVFRRRRGALPGGLDGFLTRRDLDLLAVLAGLGGDLALRLNAGGLRLGFELLHPVGDAASQGTGERRALERRLRGFLETVVIFRVRGRRFFR